MPRGRGGDHQTEARTDASGPGPADGEPDASSTTGADPSATHLAEPAPATAAAPAAAYQVTWIVAPDTPGLTSPHSGAPTTIPGVLKAFDAGLAFHDHGADQIDPTPTTSLYAPVEHLHAVWTVPASRGPDGQRRPDLPSRPSRLRRLAIAHANGILLFAAWRARRRADELAEIYGLERRPDL